MKKGTLNAYEAPALEIVVIRLEQGFATSTNNDYDIDSAPDNDYGEFTY